MAALPRRRPPISSATDGKVILGLGCWCAHAVQGWRLDSASPEAREHSQPGMIELSLKPVHGGSAEVGKAVLRPQAAVPSEAIAVVGPGGDLRVAPSFVGDAGEPRQQQEAQIVEIGDRLASHCGFYSRNVRCSTGPKSFGGFPVERVCDGLG